MFLEDQFPNLQSWCTEVDQHSVSKTGGPEITEDLRDVNVCQGNAAFDLNDDLGVYDQVRNIIAEQSAVLIPH